jgi:hypothetical protein
VHSCVGLGDDVVVHMVVNKHRRQMFNSLSKLDFVTTL